MANGKVCVECFVIINNACDQCYACGALQLSFYKKQDASELKKKLALDA